MHFFSSEKAPKIEMRIIHGILCFRLASLISVFSKTRNLSVADHLLLIEKLKTGASNDISEEMIEASFFECIQITIFSC